MSELVCLEVSIALWFVHVFTQGAFAGSALGMRYLVGARDAVAQPGGSMFPRASRALANYVENLGPFVAADLGLMFTGHDAGAGAIVWILARIVYLPLYMAGVPVARTICWLISLAGLMTMLYRLAS
jgi:uncharacterized MAPEG superfamily protein